MSPLICTQKVYDSGYLALTINGRGYTASYSQSSTTSSVASALKAAITADSSSAVTATLSGTSIILTSKTTGAGTNFSYAFDAETYDSSHFSGGSFSGTPSSGSLTGGADVQNTTLYDSGTITVTINSHSAPYSWGQSSTAQTIATGLAAAIVSGSDGTLQTASSGSTVTVSSVQTGSSTNWPISISSTFDTADFTSASFGLVGAGLSGGKNATSAAVYDSGSVTITVNGTPATTSYSQNDTATTIASKLASTIGNCSSSFPASATSSGGTVSLVSCQQGGQVNYSLSSSSSYDTADFATASFVPSGSGGSMTGGTNASGTPIYDQGSVTLTVNGVPGTNCQLWPKLRSCVDCFRACCRL